MISKEFIDHELRSKRVASEFKVATREELETKRGRTSFFKGNSEEMGIEI